MTHDAFTRLGERSAIGAQVIFLLLSFRVKERTTVESKQNKIESESFSRETLKVKERKQENQNK